MTKKVKVILWICTAFSVVYVITAARPLNKELHFSTEWTIDCGIKTALQEPPENETEQLAPQYDLIPFKLGQQIGYLTQDGKILNTITFPFKASISQYRYATYNSSGTSIKLFAPDGSESGTVTSAGFPFFQEDRIYLMHAGGASFSAISEDGNVQWTYENYVPITAFASSKAGTAAGYANGTIVIFSPDGTIEQTLVPGGSKYSVILGCAISESGKYIAGLCGQENQRFFLASRTEGYTKIIFHTYLRNSLTRQVLVKFNNDENTVYFDSEDGLGILNVKTMKFSLIPINGHILSIQESDTEKTIFVLSRNGKYCTVSVIEPFPEFSGSFTFKASNSFISVKGGNLFVGRDSSITKIKAEHK